MKTKITLSSLKQFYFIVISCIFPLFLPNFYYNLQLSKSLFFLIITHLIFIGVILLTPQKKISFAEIKFLLRKPCFFLFIFMLSALISALLSNYGLAAFTGQQGRYMGFFMMLSMGLSFLIFSTNFCNLQACTVFLYLGSSLTALLGILQFIQIDPLGLSSHIPVQFKGMYLSTIGYINTFSGYISMISAFCISSYFLYGNRLLLLPSFILYSALFAGNSDTGFFCVFSVLITLFFFIKTPQELYRLLDQLLVFCFSCIVSCFLSLRALIPYQGFPALFTRPEIILPLTVLFLILRFKTAKFFVLPSCLQTMKSIGMNILISSIATLALLFLLVNLHTLDFPLLLFDDSWGSFRGFIWRKVLEVYWDAPLINKLFGYGPDTLKPLLLSMCKEEMMSITSKIYDSAHNDFLQYLVTTGLFGAFSWLMFWLSVLIQTIKSNQRRILPWLSVLIAYLVQALFIPTQPITAPLGFMIAGICIGMIHE